MCGTCSNRKYLLPYQSSKPLRVCISCYDALSASHGEERPGDLPPGASSGQPAPVPRHSDYEVHIRVHALYVIV